MVVDKSTLIGANARFGGKPITQNTWKTVVSAIALETQRCVLVKEEDIDECHQATLAAFEALLQP